MYLVSFARLLLVAATLTAATGAQVFVVGMKTATDDTITEFHPTHVELPTGVFTERTRMDLIRNLEAEQGFAHRQLPLGAGLLLVANGNMEPAGDVYKQMLYDKGQSAAPGDRIEITALQFKGDRLVIDFNGGPYAKHRFLSHVQINDVPLAPLGPVATGCRITLVFEGGLPDLTAAEVKSLLDPLVDFKARSGAEAYANTLPPAVRAAIEDHAILVGMDRRMVIAAVGTPTSRHREHVADTPAGVDSPMYEEWIYGQPPQPTQFVRFHDGRVVRLEIAAIGKPLEIRDRNEIGGPAAPALHTREIANGDQPAGGADERAPAHPPTLRRPGEVNETASGVGKVNLPPDPPPAPSAPNAPKPPDAARQLIALQP